MNFLNKMKNTGVRAKIKGEIKLLELECNNRKKKFGIDLYDMVTQDKAKMLGLSSGTLVLGQQGHGEEGLLKQPFDNARQDIEGILAKKEVKQKDLDVLEVKGPQSMPNTTANDKMKQAGRAVSNAGKEAKLRTEMAMLDREIKIRKENFGLEIFDVLKSSENEKKKKAGIASKLRQSINTNAQHEAEIQACIDAAKADVTRIDGKIKSKEFEAANLED